MRSLLCLVLIAACGGGGTVAYHGSATVTVPAPDLVYVSPGVHVIADYDEPVFYTDGYYWRYYGGVWYRSHDWRGGWAYAPAPRVLLRIEQPRAYIRYRPHGWVSRRPRTEIRDHRDHRPEVRDHRGRGGPVIRDHRRPEPPRRDWRDDRRERREDRAEERRERRQERREERREQREERRDRDPRWIEKLRERGR